MTDAIAGTDTSLTIKRTFAAPRDLVFRAWTEPDRLSQWWGSGTGLFHANCRGRPTCRRTVSPGNEGSRPGGTLYRWRDIPGGSAAGKACLHLGVGATWIGRRYRNCRRRRSGFRPWRNLGHRRVPRGRWQDRIGADPRILPRPEYERRAQPGLGRGFDSAG